MVYIAREIRRAGIIETMRLTAYAPRSIIDEVVGSVS